MLSLWKKSYDRPRQCIKKQRYHFADKGPSRQSSGFSSRHVWMWEANHKERLKLKLQYFGHLMPRTNLLEKTLMLGKMKARREAVNEDEMVGWHHWLNGHGFENTPGDSEGQGSHGVCCSPWGSKESDTTEQPNNSNPCTNQSIVFMYNILTSTCIFFSKSFPI